ncbi:MAG TPA: copper resistance protein CopC [Devosiaceae bacterium]|jgi:copper transport protein
MRRLAPLLVLLLTLLTAQSAYAHAALLATDPVAGNVLPAPPQSYALTFNEPVAPLVLTLVKPDGSSIGVLGAVIRDKTLSVAAPKLTATGTYVLSWRVISADGHPVGGSLVYSVGAPTTAGVAAAEAIDWPLDAGIWLTRVLLYAGLFLGAGAAFFIVWIGDGLAGRRLALIASVMGLAATPFALLLQGLDALDLPLGSIFEPQVFTTAIGTSYAATLLVMALALLSGLLSLWVPKGVRPLAALALVGVGIALALSGHASAAEPQWLTRPAVFIHTTAIAFWAGALLPLAVLLRRSSEHAVAALMRFSRAIPLTLVLLLIAGLTLAVVQVQQPIALLTTDYGHLLVVKLLLVLAILLLAARNRWRSTAPVLAGDAAAAQRLARTILIETLLVLAVFSVVALWRFTPPPRALLLAEAEPVSLHIHSDKAMAELTLTPGHAGPVAASIFVMDGSFGPLNPKDVTLALSRPQAGIEPLRYPAVLGEDGSWHVDQVTLPQAGDWTAEVDVLVDDFTMVQLKDVLTVRP